MDIRHNFGNYGERVALNFLQNKGYKIIDKNVRIGRGEIDIIARKKNLIVFVEVKCRMSDVTIDLADSISYTQEQKLVGSCEKYLEMKHLKYNDYRIDLIGIISQFGFIKKILHIEGIL